MTQVSHVMPSGIRRVEKGVYVTLDGRHEVRQDGKVWRLAELVGDSTVGIGEFGSRNAAVEQLARDGKLSAEAPKPEPKAEPAGQAPRPTRRRSKEAKS
jgi:hypothetical protein